MSFGKCLLGNSLVLYTATLPAGIVLDEISSISQKMEQRLRLVGQEKLWGSWKVIEVLTIVPRQTIKLISNLSLKNELILKALPVSIQKIQVRFLITEIWFCELLTVVIEITLFVSQSFFRSNHNNGIVIFFLQVVFLKQQGFLESFIVRATFSLFSYYTR